MTDALFSLAGKTALITGGANGLGRMIADGLAAAGARILLTSRKIDEAERAAAEISASGKAKGYAADLATSEGCSDLARRIMADTDRLDILVNNAGRTWGSPLEDFPDRGWSSVMPMNVQSPFTLLRDLLPVLKASARDGDPARVINIGSITGKVVEPLAAYSYVASKAALHHLTRVLAAELAQFGINVNAVVPGYFPTHMTGYMHEDPEVLDGLLQRVPLRRMGEPADIAGACIYLASRAGAYVTGSELVVDGGMAGCR